MKHVTIQKSSVARKSAKQRTKGAQSQLSHVNQQTMKSTMTQGRQRRQQRSAAAREAAERPQGIDISKPLFQSSQILEKCHIF